MTINKHIKIAAAVALSLNAFGAVAQVQWPAVTQQTKPWARWWWEGSAVNKRDLTWNMEDFRAAGLGGVEITPIYGVKGKESEFIQFLSPQWVNVLQHTLTEGKRLNMGIDVANATGWPFGGPWVTDEHASKEMFWKTYDVKGGAQLAEPVTFIQPALVRSEGGAKVAITDLVDPIAKNKNLQLLAFDQVRFEKRIPLVALVAYDGKGQHINLISKVAADGKLTWTAPEGDWKLYAIFEGMHGKMVERAAPGGEGYVIDHFSKPALTNYLSQFDKAFAGHDMKGIRSFFNDSYEVDDARGQSNITPQVFDEFIKRRGYDLRDHLPALFGKDSKDMNNRVLCDYRETISDLLLDNFTKPWEVWGRSKGALIRNQSHGSPSNILDLYAAIDIPETEGNDILRFKFATSAAHVMGKPLASSESATWLDDHFLSSLGGVKKAIDKFFVGGVNHVFYHGISYSPQNAPWPGWLFYASVHFSQTNPFWNDFSTLNNYISRTQSFLQQGKANNDVLVYYPIFDSYSEPARNGDLLKHYDAMKPDFANTGFGLSTEEMLEKGFSFDFISDKQILNLQQAGSQLLTGDVKYKTIMLPDCRYIPTTTFAKIMAMAKAGATVVVYKNLPSQVPGLGKLTEREAEFKAMLSAIKFTQTKNGVKKAIVGKGQFLIGDEIGPLLQIAGIDRETMTDNGLQFSRREYKNGNAYFVSNSSDKVVDAWVPLTIKAASVVIFDPMTQKSGIAKINKQPNGQTNVYLQLQPGESCILQTAPTVLTGDPYTYYQPAGDAVSVAGNWTLKFTQGGPALPQPIQTTELRSWTELGGDDVKAFSGTGSYNISFNKPSQAASAWALDLGKVDHEAEVFLNGIKIATLLGPKYVVTIPASQLKAVNQLEVRVANLMANRVIDMERKNIPYKIYYNTNFPAHDAVNRGADGLFTTLKWEPKPSGLLGPVTLTPVKIMMVK